MAMPLQRQVMSGSTPCPYRGSDHVPRGWMRKDERTWRIEGEERERRGRGEEEERKRRGRGEEGP